MPTDSPVSIDPETASAEAMMQTMAGMQDRYNTLVHPQWRTQGYGYYRAIWVECAELLDHYGWKWWKRQTPDLDQVRLEIVDIWHFGLSDLLRADAVDEAVLGAINVAQGAPGEGVDGFRQAVEDLAQATLAARRFVVEPFARVMLALPMSFRELFELYVGKNVLNAFRQDHGYKSGTYSKTWHGREDNEHLIEVLAMLRCPAEELPDRLYDALRTRYPDAG
jgi:hypothetical protein